MQTTLVQEWIYALLRELDNHKGKVAISFAVVTALVVVAAFLWPKVYASSSVIYADEQNIIKPLLEGRAAVTGFGSDRLTQTIERLNSERVLKQVVLESGLVDNLDDALQVERLSKFVARNMDIAAVGKNHMSITYYSEDPALAFRVASALTNVFVRDAAQTKQAESLEAYSFIDKQANELKAKLQEAEQRLKDFRTEHTDGTEGSVGGHISALRKSIEDMELELQVAKARRDELRSQVTQEGRRLNQNYRAEVYRQRLAEAQARLDELRLSYQDTYPDIVGLKEQIEDMKRAIADAESDTSSSIDSESVAANPVYQQLRTALSEAEVGIRTIELRLASTRRSLTEAESKSVRVTELQAQLAELTRDYDVTRSLYEDLLTRRERARISMALDEEGQGVNYKVATAPRLPKIPDGIRFVHIFSAAPFLGLMLPLGALFGYIFLDPRVRFLARLEDSLPPQVPVLALIPHVTSPHQRRIQRVEWMQVGIFFVVVLIGYFAVAAASFTGAV
jgi:polysaccharide chain length determinant protein (PEP-CTERM system associated)